MWIKRRSGVGSASYTDSFGIFRGKPMNAKTLSGLLVGSLVCGTLTAQAQTAANPTTPAPQAVAPGTPGPAAPAPPTAPPPTAPQLAPAPPPAPPPTYVLVPMPRDPGARLHDGFYLRMSIGIGPGSGTWTHTDLGLPGDQVKLKGTGAMFDIMIGGSPVPGFVLGGAFVSHHILNPKLTSSGQSSDTFGLDITYDLNTLGLFAAVYPDPKHGFNLHALVGYSEISVSSGNIQSTHNPVGFGIMGGVGYDFWVGDQWSVGPDLRIAYAKGSIDSGGVKDDGTYFMPTLSFTGTYH